MCIDRCLSWDPPFLLTILSKRSKNGFLVPNLAEARRILHRLVFYRPPEVAQSTVREVKRQGNADALKNTATFAALMPTSGLKLVEKDLVCCALLAQACARNLLLSVTPTTEGKADASHVPEAQPSIDGLKSLSRSLASILSSPSAKKNLPLPTKDAIKEWSATYKEAGVKDPRGRLNPLVFQDRESGVTQTGVVEKMWTFEAIKDVVKAVKIIEGIDVDEKVLQTLTSVIEASERVSVTSFTPPKPWVLDTRTQRFVLPEGISAS